MKLLKLEKITRIKCFARFNKIKVALTFWCSTRNVYKMIKFYSVRYLIQGMGEISYPWFKIQGCFLNFERYLSQATSFILCNIVAPRKKIFLSLQDLLPYQTMKLEICLSIQKKWKKGKLRDQVNDSLTEDTLCSYHFMWALYSWLNVKELLSRNRCDIWNLGGCGFESLCYDWR